MYLPKSQLNYAVYQLKKNGVIAHPTDTIYGLSTLPTLEASFKILALKNRSIYKGLILLSSDIRFIDPFIDLLNTKQISKLQNNKTPTTYLVNKNNDTPDYIYGDFDTVAVRITQHPIIAYLCRKTNSALLSSSANISGYSPTKSGLKCRHYFSDKLDAIILPNRPKNETKSSSIIDLKTGKIYRK